MTDQLFVGEDHTAKYRIYRPTYPKELFEHIVNYYFDGKTIDKKIALALDVGCGSGQATVDLSLFCERVIGIDVSENQIANAIQRDNIEYRCNKAEDLSFIKSNSIDLITIATTLHWIDIQTFVNEVKRILKPDTGVFAVWTYAFGTLDNPKADVVNREFYYDTLRPYWHEKQYLVEEYYQSILPYLPYQSTFCHYIIRRQIETTLKGLIGFIETASTSQIYRKQNTEQIYQNTLNKLRQKLIQSYVETEDNIQQTIDFDSIKITMSSPIHLYLMKKNEM